MLKVLLKTHWLKSFKCVKNISENRNELRAKVFLVKNRFLSDLLTTTATQKSDLVFR